MGSLGSSSAGVCGAVSSAWAMSSPALSSSHSFSPLAPTPQAWLICLRVSLPRQLPVDLPVANLRHTSAGLTVVAETATTVFAGVESASHGLLALVDGLVAVATGAGIAVTEGCLLVFTRLPIVDMTYRPRCPSHVHRGASWIRRDRAG